MKNVKRLLVDLLDDLAQRGARGREVALARVREAAEVQRRREEARLPVDVREVRLGGRQVVRLVGDLAGEVLVLGAAVARELGGVHSQPRRGLVEHGEHRRLLARLERDVDHGAVGGREEGRLRAVRRARAAGSARPRRRRPRARARARA